MDTDSSGLGICQAGFGGMDVGQPPSQQTGQLSMQSPNDTGLRSRRKFV